MSYQQQSRPYAQGNRWRRQCSSWIWKGAGYRHKSCCWRKAGKNTGSESSFCCIWLRRKSVVCNRWLPYLSWQKAAGCDRLHFQISHRLYPERRRNKPVRCCLRIWTDSWWRCREWNFCFQRRCRDPDKYKLLSVPGRQRNKQSMGNTLWKCRGKRKQRRWFHYRRRSGMGKRLLTVSDKGSCYVYR